tara:strand:+ start:123 stop:302 length:180 start_codon:yes stop_codon:yes gene_type:complete
VEASGSTELQGIGEAATFEGYQASAGNHSYGRATSAHVHLGTSVPGLPGDDITVQHQHI